MMISNLPEGITPPQIRQILSYIKSNWSSDGLKKVESGVTVIQIYPSESSSKKARVRDHASNPPVGVHLQSPDSAPPYLGESPFSDANTPDPLTANVSADSLVNLDPSRPSPGMPSIPSLTATSDAVSDQLWDVARPIHTLDREVVHLDSSDRLPSGIVKKEGSCVAYIHFSSMGHLFQAETNLRQVTVNGKRVKVRYKWWTSAPLFRVWAKVRSGARVDWSGSGGHKYRSIGSD